MRKLFLLFSLWVVFGSNGQPIQLDSFQKIIVNPHVEVELRQGDQEQIEWLTDQVDPDYLVAKVVGKTLHVYIEDVRVTARRMVSNKLNQYVGPKVRAIVTYKKLKKLTLYGEEDFVCHDELSSKKIKLIVAGDNDVELGPISAQKFKAVLYGDNRLKVAKSLIHRQVFTSYGDNTIFADKLDGHRLKFTNFGDNKLYTGKHNVLSVIAFGDALIGYEGDPILEQRFVIGNIDFRSN